MGEVKESIKGESPARPKRKKSLSADAQNIIDDISALRDEVSQLASIKDEDALSEGDAAKADNTRKAGLLRAVHSLLTATQTILEDY